MTPPALVALLVMTAGVVLYTYNDTTLTATGLIACFIDIFVGIIAALLQRRYIALHPVSISFGGMLLLQNVVGGRRPHALPTAPRVCSLSAPDPLVRQLLPPARSRHHNFTATSPPDGSAARHRARLRYRRAEAVGEHPGPLDG